ncbi:MAG: hypothetical protein ABR562_08025 [Thermoplasmatota archaeon]
MPTVNVDAETYTAFTAAVLAKHGKLRGAVQEEATAAIRAHTTALRP